MNPDLLPVARFAPELGMSLWRTLPRHSRVLAPLAALHLGLLLVLRAAFWMVFQGSMIALPSPVLAKALFVGVKFDVRLTLLTLLPPALVGWIGPLSLVDGRPGRRLWSVYFGVAVGLTFLVYEVDFGHFAYLATRINARVLDLLADTAISLRMVWESYPVVWGALGLAIVVAGYLAIYHRLVRRVAAERPAAVRRGRQTAVVALVVVAWVFGIWGKLQWFPLRWSDAFFATDVWSPALALNPVLNLADTLKNKARGFDEAATREYYAEVAAYLGVEHPDPATLSFRREVRARTRPGRPPNVIVILLEEGAHYKTGMFGNPLQPTPILDALAREGILFRRFYTPTFGTARSVFALVTGIPDVETHETATRNPLVVDQRTIVNALEGYEKLYFLGGSLNWGNVRGVLAHNIPGLRLFEEGSYKAPRVDGWGISDLSLFEEANEVFRTIKDRPFFAVIQTAAHHRPYTIPDDNRGFVRVEVPPERLRAAGFSELDEFNSMRFLDHSVGVFFSIARREAYFQDTIFVLFGDHGSFSSTAAFEKAESALDLTRFHVPGIIVGPPVPGTPRVIDTLASEVDVLPTIAGLVGVPYVNTTLGQDLLDSRFESKRYAFTLDDHSLDPKLGLVTADAYLQIGVANGQVRLVELGGDGTTDVAARYPARVRELTRMCRGLYEASRWLMYHNAQRAPIPPAR
jgi:phosphoglycerol transferase MdoB-like AlkP superfamily enzyme